MVTIREENKRAETLRIKTAQNLAESRLLSLEKDKNNIKEHDGFEKRYLTERQSPLLTKKKVGEIVKLTGNVHNITKQINWSEDGTYFVVFIISLIMDMFTIVSGIIEGGLATIPFVGQIAAIAVSGTVTPFIFGASTVIALLYALKGHYKQRVFWKSGSLLGISVLEILPVASILPGFTFQFFVNYGMILYERAVGEVIIKQQNKVSVSELKQTRQEYLRRIREQRFADDYNYNKKKAA